MLAGVLGFLGTFFAFLNVVPLGLGICLLASGLAFGLLANAVGGGLTAFFALVIEDPFANGGLEECARLIGVVVHRRSLP